MFGDATAEMGWVEPWNFDYQCNAASRKLNSHIPLDRLLPIVKSFYRKLGFIGVDDVEFDLEEKIGKSQVAECNFGDRRIEGNKPIVSASYRTGGIGNLSELIHETGHAAHLYGIKARVISCCSFDSSG